jgi:hypothetical protein
MSLEREKGREKKCNEVITEQILVTVKWENTQSNWL